jgi:hypothetical protein
MERCPKCEHEVEVQIWVPGECPICNTSYVWSDEDNIPSIIWLHVKPSPALERLKVEAEKWAKIYAWIRRRLAEEGFEFVPQDIRNVVGDLSEQGIKLTRENLLKAVLKDNYQEWVDRGCELGEFDGS